MSCRLFNPVNLLREQKRLWKLTLDSMMEGKLPKKFKCEEKLCTKAFRTGDSLNQHVKAVHWRAVGGGGDHVSLRTQMKAKKIDKSAINLLPLATLPYNTKVEIIDDSVSAKKAVETLLREGVVGFDTETRPNFVKGQRPNDTALVQFASRDRAFLFRLKHMGGISPLIPLLESADTVKAGVAMDRDIKELQRLRRFKPGGLAEVTDLSHKLSIVNAGLRPLAALLLGVRISKNAQMSNWENPVLTQAQVQYAAMDAWIGLQLYLKMNEMLKANEEESKPNNVEAENFSDLLSTKDLPVVSNSGPQQLPELEEERPKVSQPEGITAVPNGVNNLITLNLKKKETQEDKQK